MEIDTYLEKFIIATLGKKARNVVVLDVHKLTSITNLFIVCSGTSSRQVIAIADHIRDSLKKQSVRPLSIEGMNQGKWVLLDYGDAIIHVFHEPVREFYDIEGLWCDAKRIRIDHLTPPVLDSNEEDDEFIGDDDD